MVFGLPSVSASRAKKQLQRAFAPARCQGYVRVARRRTPQPPRQVQQVRRAGEAHPDKQRVRLLCEHRQAERRQREPQKIPGDEAADEGRRPGDPTPERPREDGGDPGTRGGHRERVDQ